VDRKIHPIIAFSGDPDKNKWITLRIQEDRHRKLLLTQDSSVQKAARDFTFFNMHYYNRFGSILVAFTIIVFRIASLNTVIIFMKKIVTISALQ